MDKHNTYASWDSYAVTYNDKSKDFSIQCQKKTNAVKLSIKDIILGGNSIGGIEQFKTCKCESGRSKGHDSRYLLVKFSGGKNELKTFRLKFIVSADGIKLDTGAKADCKVVVSGVLNWGNGKTEDVYPMSSQQKNTVLRTAVGPASSNKDDLLFDRLTDSALSLTGLNNLRINYNWKTKKYVFNAETGANRGGKMLNIEVKKGLLEKEFGIVYSPLNKNATFKKPPVGWMTWYAVKFTACEEKVLKNARWMSENLKDYGVDCIWVDWEWYHKDMSGTRDDGCDTFNPDKEKYPHGLKYLSDKIREMGLIPALWIGFTCDPGENDFIKENPEIILHEEPRWPGRYFFDFSHPKYLNEFLPKALANVFEWGYDAVKYDTLPLTMILHDEYHHNMYDPSLTTKDAFRNMIKKARSILGKDMYMLSCAAANDQDVLWGADVFDSARIGGDIFKWSEFLKQGVLRTMKYYPLHNNVLYPDADNVVMREEFNTQNQAASRIYFVSMLGIPITFGDEFDVLDDKRIDFIKECLPVLETHPMDIYRCEKLEKVLKMNLAINKEWGSYNVVNVFNTVSDKSETEVRFCEDLGLDTENKEYIVYNYTDDVLVKSSKDAFNVKLDDSESKIFSVREKLDHPQIISTSRHISQGAAEIAALNWNNSASKLSVSAELIKNVPYTITFYVPDGFAAPKDLTKVEKNIYKKTVTNEKGGLTDITISFAK